LALLATRREPSEHSPMENCISSTAARLEPFSVGIAINFDLLNMVLILNFLSRINIMGPM